LLDTDATPARLRELSSGADLIHLAAHGVARLDAPLFFVRASGRRHLTALDCFDLELDCALVTLSGM